MGNSEVDQNTLNASDNCDLGDFFTRHCGSSKGDLSAMAKFLGFSSTDKAINSIIPSNIKSSKELKLTDFESGLSEFEALAQLKELSDTNLVWRSYIGLGYHNTVVPSVIKRIIFENPGWYTQYTPYQPEISQGRLEALLNYQTMISDLTGLPISNSSLLDEGTAVAEAVAMCLAMAKVKSDEKSVVISKASHPHVIRVLKTRMEPLGVTVKMVEKQDEIARVAVELKASCVVYQYPDTYGAIYSPEEEIKKIQSIGGLAIMSCDLLSLTMLKSPGAMGADVAVGTSQRFGVPLGFGGPHAAFFATKDKYKRKIPGRLVGLSKDSNGNDALRLTLQTREQHIRREKATSNICTAQVLLAVMAGMYGVYHGADGLLNIATQVHQKMSILAEAVDNSESLTLVNTNFFDTIHIKGSESDISSILGLATKNSINLCRRSDNEITIAFDECVTVDDIVELARILGVHVDLKSSASFIQETRATPYLEHEVFKKYRSESEFLRYVTRLQAKDLSLCNSMIPLGSCTMKLNSAAEMVGVSWDGFSSIHPYAPDTQTIGVRKLASQLEGALAEITGFSAVSLQPNAGSQGEFAGLLAIKAFHESRGDSGRNICLIPRSAHGTNPASAIMAGMKVVVVECADNGDIDIEDLRAKAEANSSALSSLMVTYPSTHGVFEDQIREITNIIHENGGQVYMDGANLNALVGLVNARELGMDVCHINLHKTFCIPHGGGGPGVGPVAVAEHLAPFLPSAPTGNRGVALEDSSGCDESEVGMVASAPYGSASILPISWMYLRMMGSKGVTEATKIAILNANYMAKRLEPYYPVLFKGKDGFVAHECVLDLRGLKSAGIEVDDVAKRLMDFGFHAPTVSWPVPGTIMIEPTESEAKAELDLYCDALIAIKKEADEVASGKLDPENNPLKNAPHTIGTVTADKWDRPYTREQAAFPAEWVRMRKFWPAVGRIDAAYGDKNVICTCISMDEL